MIVRFSPAVLFVGLIGLTLSPWVGARDVQDPGDPQEAERQCQSHAGDTETDPASCSFDWAKDTANCPMKYEILNPTCSDQVVTYTDDACDGSEGECEPPSESGGIKTLTTSATPSVSAGCSLAIPTSCSCKLGSMGSATYGRLTCGGI